MARFHFKYEAVLRQRQAVEDQRQRELATHLRHRHILSEQLGRMRRTVKETRQQLGQGLVGSVDVERIRQFAQYSGHVTVQVQQMMQRLGEIERQIDSAREALTEAMRQRKAMEILRDKQYQQWLLEQRRREVLELDELAVQRFDEKAGEFGATGAVRGEVSP